MGEFELRITLEEYGYDPKLLELIRKMKSDAVKKYDSELFNCLSKVEDAFLEGKPEVQTRRNEHKSNLHNSDWFSDN